MYSQEIKLYTYLVINIYVISEDSFIWQRLSLVIVAEKLIYRLWTCIGGQKGNKYSVSVFYKQPVLGILYM